MLRKRKKVIDAGGLFVIASERHESRRIGQPVARPVRGVRVIRVAPTFYLSLEDDLMRIFGSERLDKVLKTLGPERRREAIIHPWINKSLERAQAKVEGPQL